MGLALASLLTFGDARRGPPPVAPNPCRANATVEPKFHIYNMGIGPHDPNAIFRYQGVWHVYHQANWTDWAHLTSYDLVHWLRRPSALYPNGDWDGSLTLLDGEPLILFDCYSVADCRPLVTGNGGRFSSAYPLDPPHVGVARPANTSDPHLLDWVKDTLNPITVTSSTGAPITRGYAGPSNVWRAAGAMQMLMQLGEKIARFESTDPRLHNWSAADPAFFPSGGRGGRGSESIAFFPLRPTPPAGGPTHLLGGLWPSGTAHYSVGTAWYYLVTYNATSRSLINASGAIAQPLDSSALVNWPITHEAGDGRLLHLAWFNVQPTQGCLTVPRTVTYDATTRKLLALPVAEIATLRTESLGKRASVVLAPGASLSLFDQGKVSTTFDLEAEIGLPTTATSQLRLSLLAKSATSAAVLVDVHASAPANDGCRSINMSAAVPHATDAKYNTTGISFLLPATSPLAIRALADRMLVEVFIGGGRGVVSSPVLAPDPTFASAFVTNIGDAGVTLASAQAWGMGCGWARYP